MTRSMTKEDKMLLWLLLAAALLLIVSAALADPTPPTVNVPLAWNASVPPPTNAPVTNYTIYYWPQGGATNRVLVGTNLTCTVSNLLRGQTWFFVATATDTNSLESGYSNEVNTNAPTPPPPPTVLKVVIGP